MYVPASQLTQKTPETKKKNSNIDLLLYLHVHPLLTHCAMVQIRQEGDVAHKVGCYQ